jgi:hypothetical protein
MRFALFLLSALPASCLAATSSVPVVEWSFRTTDTAVVTA